VGVGSVSDYSSILKNYKVPTIPDMSLEEIRGHRPGAQENEAPAVADAHVTPDAAASKRKEARLEDISITFNRQESFGYIGRDSDIRLLDVEKAIDDMKKDQVLQKYQYFVGSSSNLYGAEGADGTVIQKF